MALIDQPVARRLLSVSVVLLAALSLLALFPIGVIVAVLLDLVRRRRFSTVRGFVFLTVFATLESLGVVGAGVLWLTRPFRNSARFVAANFALQRWWASTLIDVLERLYALRFVIDGDPVGGGPVLMLLRHASVADTILPIRITGGETPLNPRYVLKKGLLWDPCLDIVGHRLPNAFIERDSANPDAQREAVATLADDLDTTDFVAIFPEGTRFTEARRARLLSRLAAAGESERLALARDLRRVLPPKPGGVLALLERAPPIDVVLVVHSGLDVLTRLSNVSGGGLVGATVRVRLRRVPADQIPADAASRRAWLDEAWRWMDREVQALEAEGSQTG